ncbi:leucine-rich repeat protein [Plasmodium gallinaceum]|uniref:Leucine-rich repeat-containing protein 51 n=1 Tax=Plasmodium gallinaceum TaxID=5849 RepID=A0A1J1GR25_PLAGA|nr:leucine-rich repeat protein [Plasmodium gallinaceum]CRG94880.1 leucine-rich repeat protein [Plasmodium gallinaceum]
MENFNSLKLSYNEYETLPRFYETNNTLSEDTNDESDNSDKRKNLNDDLNKDENNKIEKYIKLKNTMKIWAGTNKIITYEKKNVLELNKIIYNYNNKEINVSSNSKVLNINNNNLEDLCFMNDLLRYIYQQKNIELTISYSNIISLDISFNNLVTIDDSLLVLNNLKTLYIHSNKIENIGEIQKLESLSKLKNLTLENNPIMELYNKFYRPFVIHYLPHIKSLDFHDVTKIEKNKSDITFNTHKYKFNLQ